MAYVDGGCSGGNVDRPALRRLLDDIRARRIDTVIVYKVDRLTRSLNDFAKIIEVFDAHEVSFVSVTQAFNTTTSMGRLTLNMLLSFAQFEREVTSARIRDKIAASKKKGMWMGGPPPLDYDVKDRKLTVNPDEAETVRAVFNLYLNCGTVKALRDKTIRLKLTTKRRPKADGRTTGGRPFTRGHLYRLLGNPLYIGKVVHKGTPFRGQHTAIIEEATFEADARQLAENTAGRRLATNAKAPSLLSGLVYDEAGDRLCPTHANKNGRHYRYYISRRVMHRTGEISHGWRIPADELEGAVRQALEMLLKDEHRMVEEMLAAGLAIAKVQAIIANQADFDFPEALANRQILRHLLNCVTLACDAICLTIDRAELVALTSGMAPKNFTVTDKTLDHVVPIRLQRRGVETTLVIQAQEQIEPRLDPKLIAYIARARRWLDELASGKIGAINEIAARDNIDASDVGCSLQCAFLAPDTVEAIREGRQPVELTTRRLRRIGTLPIEWQRQRHLFGFSA